MNTMSLLNLYKENMRQLKNNYKQVQIIIITKVDMFELNNYLIINGNY